LQAGQLFFGMLHHAAAVDISCAVAHQRTATNREKPQGQGAAWWANVLPMFVSIVARPEERS
jgi:hypothetical protein